MSENSIPTVHNSHGTAMWAERVLASQRWLSGIEFIDAEATEWLAEWQRLTSPAIPLIVPWFVDLGFLITQPHPVWRSLPALDPDRAHIVGRYQEKHLFLLNAQPVIRTLRERVTRSSVSRSKIVARFAHAVFSWLRRNILRDPKNSLDWLLNSDAQRTPVLRRSEDVIRFFAQLPDFTRSFAPLDQAVSPLNAFLLSSMCEIEQAYERANTSLITRCLMSHDLDEDHVVSEATVPIGGDRYDLSQHRGDHVAVRGVRKTTDPSRISEVIPQDLSLLRHGQDGRRQFIHKLAHEGMLIPERQHFTARRQRQRVLVCLAARIGETVNRRRVAFYWNPKITGSHSRPGELDVDSVDTHARSLICDILRDLALGIRDHDLAVEIQIFLTHPDSQLSRSLNLSLEQIRDWLGPDRYDFLLELESQFPGYFFEEQRKLRPPWDDPRHYMERNGMSAEYCGRVFVLLGREGTLDQWVPRTGPGHRQAGLGQTDLFLAQLGRWPTQLKFTAISTSVASPQLWNDQFMTDEDLRLRVVQSCLGAAMHGKYQVRE